MVCSESAPVAPLGCCGANGSAAPHPLQNLAVDELTVRQCGQGGPVPAGAGCPGRGNGARHDAQKRASSRFREPQLGQSCSDMTSARFYREKKWSKSAGKTASNGKNNDTTNGTRRGAVRAPARRPLLSMVSTFQARNVAPSVEKMP